MHLVVCLESAQIRHCHSDSTDWNGLGESVPRRCRFWWTVDLGWTPRRPWQFVPGLPVHLEGTIADPGLYLLFELANFILPAANWADNWTDNSATNAKSSRSLAIDILAVQT